MPLYIKNAKTNHWMQKFRTKCNRPLKTLCRKNYNLALRVLYLSPTEIYINSPVKYVFFSIQIQYTSYNLHQQSKITLLEHKSFRGNISRFGKSFGVRVLPSNHPLIQLSITRRTKATSLHSYSLHWLVCQY